MAVYIICYIASMLWARISQYAVSGLLLIVAALYLYIKDYKKTGSPINLRGLYTLGLVGGQGISALKLSFLQDKWSYTTWAVLFVAYSMFWVAYEFFYQIGSLRSRVAYNNSTEYAGEQGSKNIFLAIIIITILSSMAFLIEARLLGYIPLFVRGVPHAYSYFHITGVHYITVACVLVPSLSVIFFSGKKQRDTYQAVTVAFATTISLAIPILCVSRFQFVFAMLMALVTYITMHKNINIKICLPALIAIIPVYIILTIARSHDISYLNSIFEMRYDLPIWISQPYIYIANNFDNLDKLIKELPKFTYGARMLFPVWTLTGLKFLFPALVQFPIYVTKTELTTVTLLYDAYYDFGIIGVGLFTALLGFVSQLAQRKIYRPQNPISYLLYAQLAIYLGLSFFTTWFSNPTTWFYLVVSLLIYVFCNKGLK